jgi:hypothetical protein
LRVILNIANLGLSSTDPLDQIAYANMAVERLGSILKHLSPGSSLSQITSKNADDIVITLAIRTPLTKARKGGFKDTSLEYMVYALLKEVRERSNIDPALVEDICLGNVRLHPDSLFFSTHC